MDENHHEHSVEKVVLFDAVTEREQAEAAQRRTAFYEAMGVRRQNQTRTLDIIANKNWVFLSADTRL